MFKLFIDDERQPIDSTCVIARSSVEAIEACKRRGRLPDEIMFDHDLGGDDTSMLFINWMVDILLDKVYILPYWFKFSVHSQNPVGAERITEYMNSIVRHFG